jgi:GH25 family lysozyme M1 (1,4-beta-N-acetylmuramidase)
MSAAAPAASATSAAAGPAAAPTTPVPAATDSVTAGPTAVQAAQPAATTSSPRGVDVSSFQGKPANWKSEAGRISWAAVKLTELEPSGTRYVNPDAAADWAFLKANSKGRIAYLFGHPSVSAANTVSFFIDQLRKLVLEDRDAIALDLEVTNGKTPAEVAAWAVKVQEGLFHATGRTPLLYTFLSFAEEGNCAGLGSYPLWIADPSSSAGHPRVPGPWRKWAIHQYSITGSIDRDVGNFASKTAMFNALGKPERPVMLKLGGSIVGALTSVRWPDGVTVVAGWGQDGFIQATRWQNGKWSAWKNISTTKAKGAPGLVAFGSAEGHLYFTNDSNAVIQLTTNNSGESWS